MKKNYRAIPVITAALIMSVTMSACGSIDMIKNLIAGKEETAAEETTETETAETEDSDITSIVSSDGQGIKSDYGDKEEETAAAQADDPEIIIMRKYYYEMSEDNYYNTLLSGHVQIPLLTDESAQAYPQLAAALSNDAKDQLASYDDMVENCIKEVKEWYPEMDPENFYASYQLDRDVIIKRSDSRVLSLFLYDVDYYGGAHGIYGNTGLTYDAQTGESLELKDVLASTDGFNDLVKAELERKYTDPDMFFDLDENIKHYVPENVPDDQDFESDDYKLSFIWALNSEGLEIYFGPYALAAYASGDQTVVFKYDEVPELFDPKYLPAEADAGFIEYFGRYTGDFDVDGDGEVDYIGVENEYTDNDWDSPTGLSVYVDDETLVLPDECNYEFTDDVRSYYVHTSEGRNFIYILVPEYNDYIDLFVVEVTGGKLKYAGTQFYPSFYIDYDEKTDCSREFLLSDPEHMHFADHFDIICSFRGFRTYHVGSDGMPETDEDTYVIYDGRGWKDITVAQSFEAICIDDENAPEVITLNVGDTMVLTGTDGKTYIDAVLSDGRKIRMDFSLRGYDLIVNGEKAEDLFGELMYAG